MAASDYRGEISISDEILKRMSDSYRRMRNTARYLLGNLHGFTPDEALPLSEMLALDRWAVGRARALQDQIVQAYDAYEFHQIYHKVHNFCAVDMGSIYLDIIKDRQYTTQADSLARRSAQTALYHIAEALVRWLAPVLSFTAEEIWQHIPGERGADSVFLTTWYDLPAVGEGPISGAEWQRVMEVREAVAKELERLRVAGEIGSSLDAEVDLYCGREIHDVLQKFGDELRFVLITSYARVHLLDSAAPAEAMHFTLSNNDELWIAVAASAYGKCVRCWHHREDVGDNATHAELCGRCVDNVAGAGEPRLFA